MEFDPCPHRITNLVVRAAKLLRKAQGLPDERNITKLYEWMAPQLGLPKSQMSSKTVSRFPSPAEMTNQDGSFIVPRKPCPKCGSEMVLAPICLACHDSEGGKYKSGYQCRNKRCRFVDEKDERPYVKRLTDMGIEVPTGMKETLGIKTITDDGLK